MILKDKKLSRLLKEKQEVIIELKKKVKEAERLQKELNKLALKRSNLIARIVDKVEKKKIELEEFEEIESVELKGKDIELNKVNVVERFKKEYLERKQNESKNKVNN